MKNINRFETQQYLCVKCGFRTGADLFDKSTDPDGREKVVCPECGSDEVVDADSRVKVN